MGISSNIGHCKWIKKNFIILWKTKKLIDTNNNNISLSKQLNLLCINRSSDFYNKNRKIIKNL